MSKLVNGINRLSGPSAANFPVAFSLLIILIVPIAAFAEIDSLYLEGQHQYQKRHFDSAITLFSQLIRNYPAKIEGYYNRGLAFYNVGKYSKAISDFDQCIEIDSTFIEARFMKSNALEKTGDLKGAITELEQLKTKNNNYDEVEKRIKNYRLSVYLAEKWYYMIAMMFLFILFIATGAKFFFSKK